MPARRGRSNGLLAASALISPALFFLLSLPGLSWVDEKSRDVLVCLHRDLEQSREATLLYLDEETYRAYGLPLSAWTGPLAELVDRLVSEGARAVVFDFLILPADPSAASTLPLARALARASAQGVPVIVASELAPNGTIKYPYPLVRQAAAATGFFNLSPSSDGVVRQQEMHIQTEEGPLLSLASAAYASLAGLSPEDFRKSFPKKIRLNFRPRGAFQSASILRFMRENADPAVRGRTVFVGPSPDFLSDITATPFNILGDEPGDLYSGLEIHATTFTNLSQKSFIRDLPGTETAALLIVGTVILFSLGARHSTRRLGLLLGGLGLIHVSAALFALRHNTGLPVLSLLVPWTAQAGVSVGIRFWVLDRKKRALEKAFGRYVNPLLLASILENEDEIDESGKMVEACILVTDLKGFTTISEWMDPRDLVAMLNEYFEWTTQIIREEDGLVLSFPGDAILAVFGVPVAAGDCGASAALRAALRLWSEAERRKVSIHVAVSKGPLVIGRIGSRFKSDFTVIGDTVNTAFRIEAYSDDKGLVLTENVLLSATRETARLCEYIETSEVQVKGKGKAVAIVKVTPVKGGGT
ncbi:MAG: adenylate/guanylate cyclase domain-containing protein [Nitrospirae bacterium]|nr:adenylate/guanylate cyclase domain-containing protein [Nitrospirota bacterium]